MAGFAKALLRDPAVQRHARRRGPPRTSRRVRANVLAQKLVQLTMPGVPDVYQGSRSSTSRSSTPTTAARSTATDRGERLAGLDGERGPRPRRREAAGHRRARCGCAATCPVVRRADGTTYAGLPTDERARARLRARRRRRRRASSRWPPGSRAARATRGLRRRDRRAAGRHLARRALRPTRRWTTAASVPLAEPAGAPLPVALLSEAVVTAPTTDLASGRRSPSASRSTWTPSPSRPRVDRAHAAARPDDSRRRRLVALGPWRRGIRRRGCRSTTRSCSTAASRPCPTRAAPGSRTACTGRAASSTRRTLRLDRRRLARAACRRRSARLGGLRAARRAPSPRRAPSTPPSAGSTTSSRSASTSSS